MHGLLMKDYGKHCESVTQRIRAASVEQVNSLGRPVIYVKSAKASKEEIARKIALEHQITQGPICVLSSTEQGWSFDLYRNKETKHLDLVPRIRRCLFLYHYMIHPTFGFMNARIQTWFPFSIQVCLNGREWLASEMNREGLSFSRCRNCFVRLESADRAQELLNAQLDSDWPDLLGGISRILNPLHDELFGKFCPGYYWSTHQSEWATDILFSDPKELRILYPKLVRHGMTALGSPDVMRFLGQKLGPSDRMHPAFQSEVVSDIKTRQEGIRIKHRIGGNSVKAYDKAYTDDAAVLRVETTMHDESDFKVYRSKEGDPEGKRDWRKLRKGVADLPRRAQVSQACNERYLSALAAVDESSTLEEITQRVTMRTNWKGKSVRALHPFDQADADLLAIVGRGEFAINGLRNRDIQAILYANEPNTTPEMLRTRSAKVTRLIRMLRAHGILVKVPKTNRYQLSAFGRQLTTATSAARHIPIGKLLPLAA
jgi:hypothetical protein